MRHHDRQIRHVSGVQRPRDRVVVHDVGLAQRGVGMFDMDLLELVVADAVGLRSLEHPAAFNRTTRVARAEQRHVVTARTNPHASSSTNSSVPPYASGGWEPTAAR